MRKICVIGMGYIGLPTACMFSRSGFEVVGVDNNEEIVSVLSSGETHIKEPELEKLFKKEFKKGNLKISKSIEKSDAYIICVPTPLGKNNKADLSYVVDATNNIKKYLKEEDLIILESTSPPGTTENVVGKILNESGLIAGEDYFLVFCPERVLPGKVLYEIVHNNRVIGGINKNSAEKARKIYSRFVRGKIYITDLKTAETVKLVENAYRDVNIAFSNELSVICNKLEVSVWDVIRYANMHPRVNILSPGPGVGGHCIPIDPWFILQSINLKDTLIEKSRNTNDSMPYIVANRIMEIVTKDRRPKVTLFGASYKEDIEDTRESPTGKIYRILIENEIEVFVFDPVAKGFEYGLMDFENSLKGSELLVLLVAHKEFEKLNLKKVYNLMAKKNILDIKGFFNKEMVKRYNFNYYTL